MATKNDKKCCDCYYGNRNDGICLECFENSRWTEKNKIVSDKKETKNN